MYDFKTPEGRKAYQKDYREKNKEELKEKQKIYMQTDKAKKLKYENTKRYRKNHPEKVKIYNEKYKEDRYKHTKELCTKHKLLKMEIIEKLFGGKCLLCEEKEYCCMSFHHLDPKTKENSWANNTSRRLERLEKWLEEGKPNDIVLVCENCHRKIHNGVIKIC